MIANCFDQINLEISSEPTTSHFSIGMRYVLLMLHWNEEKTSIDMVNNQPMIFQIDCPLVLADKRRSASSMYKALSINLNMSHYDNLAVLGPWSLNNQCHQKG
jgi:hypothetical protein